MQPSTPGRPRATDPLGFWWLRNTTNWLCSVLTGDRVTPTGWKLHRLCWPPHTWCHLLTTPLQALRSCKLCSCWLKYQSTASPQTKAAQFTECFKKHSICIHILKIKMLLTWGGAWEGLEVGKVIISVKLFFYTTPLPQGFSV